MKRLTEKRKCEVCDAIFHPWPTHAGRTCSLSCRAKLLHREGKSGTRGRPAWNKGKATGLVPRTAFKKGLIPWNKGTKSPDAVTNAKIRSAVSTGIRRGLQSGRMYPGIAAFVGWTLREFREHMEPLFRPPMTWETYGKTWTIDHIRPVSSFDIKEKGDAAFRQCWALNNIQPLSPSDNSKKGDKWPEADALWLLEYDKRLEAE